MAIRFSLPCVLICALILSNNIASADTPTPLINCTSDVYPGHPGVRGCIPNTECLTGHGKTAADLDSLLSVETDANGKEVGVCTICHTTTVFGFPSCFCNKVPEVKTRAAKIPDPIIATSISGF